MNVNDTAKVLAKAAAFDRRTIGDSEILVWHEAIGDLPLGDCLNAVTAHYRESADWLTPAHIRQFAQAADHKRRGQQRAAQLATATTPDGTTLAIEGAPRGPVRDRSPEVADLVRKTVESLPQPDALSRARARARQERGRPDKQLTQPAPKKTRKPPKDYPPPVDTDGRELEEVAAQARRYLRDGYDPVDVADLFAVSRKWCRKQAVYIEADPAKAAARLAADLRRQVRPSATDPTEE